jgi:hypothetical protein
MPNTIVTEVKINAAVPTTNISFNSGPVTAVSTNSLSEIITTSATAIGSAGGSGDLSYRHIQAIPSSNWVINHNLSKYPSVTIQDSANDSVEGDLVYNTVNQLTLIFSAAFSGVAYLN